MRIAFSEPVLCGCDTCVQHRTVFTQETEPSNVTDSSVQPLGSNSDQSSGTEPPLAPPPPVTTTSVNPEPAQSATPTSPVQASPPTIFSFPPPAVSSEPAKALGPTGSLPGPTTSEVSSREANITNILDSGASAASVPSMFGPMQAPNFGSGSSSSTPSPFDAPSSNGPNTCTTPFSFLPAAQDSAKTASAFPSPFAYPVGGVRYPPNPFQPSPQTITPFSGRSPFLGGTEQGSRYPRYAPTPDLDNSGGGQGKLIISISASNSHGHKSHEELRWEDYQKGDKGGFGWFPPAHTVSPSLFASPSIPERPRMRTNIFQPTGLPMGYTNPTGLQRPPHEPVGVSPPASGCTACGATSSSSPSGHVGFTNPPSAATTLPGLFFSTYGSMPLMFGVPNLAAYGGTATTPAIHQAYAVIFLPSTTITPAVQAYPMISGTPNRVGPQGTTTTPAFQPYPMMFGTPSFAGQGTTTTTTTPAVQPYPMMFGTPNLGAQGITPAAQAYPINGLTFPFAAMSLQ